MIAAHSHSRSETADALADLVEEFTSRIQAGETIDVASFAAAHPEHAEQLRQLLPALQVLGELGHSLSRGTGCQPVAHDASAAAEMPGLLGDFRILREVGRGGMGVVYEAQQVSLGRRVALKVLPFAAALDARHLLRFKNEAQAAAQLHHTNMAPVYSVGCERGTHFYAMQFIDGQTLASVIADLRLQIADLKEAPRERGTARKSDGEKSSAPTVTQDHQIAPGHPVPPPPIPSVSPSPRPVTPSTVVALSTERSIKSAEFFRTVAQLGIQAAEALDHAHQVGIVHRDVKPANLMVENSPLAPHGAPLRLWVTDFGLAHIQHAQGVLTMSGDLIGTLRYMSPEQALAKRVIIDHRTDIYSLGATLYELLTLEPVFTGRDRQDLLRQIAFEEPQPPRRLNKAIPAELETIVMKALEKNPADRYATAQELADDLRRFLMDEPIRARRPRLVQQLRKWSRRHKTLVAGLAAMFLTALLVGSGTVLLYYRHLDIRQRETERGVTAALAQAETLVEEAYKQMDNPVRMQVSVNLAALTVQRAEELILAGVATDELELQVREVRAAIDSASKDSGVLAELDRIQIENARFFFHGIDAAAEAARTAATLRTTLRNYGLDLAAPEKTVACIRDSRVREALLAALDECWRSTPKDSAEHERVQKVRLMAEPTIDAFRARWRAAVGRGAGRALARMAVEPAVQALSPATLLNMHGDLFALKEWGASERLLRSGQERFPNNFWLNYMLANMLSIQKQPEEAARYLTAALALRSENPGVLAHIRNNLSGALFRQGNIDGAIREVQAALKISPNQVSFRANLGLYLNNKGDPDGAIRELQAALKIDPNAARAHDFLGLAFRSKQDIERAIQEFQIAVNIDPKLVSAYTNLGVALGEKGDLDGAIRAFQAALKIDPECATSRKNLGFAHQLRSTPTSLRPITSLG